MDQVRIPKAETELERDRNSRGQTREDHLTAGRQLAKDEHDARSAEANVGSDASTGPADVSATPDELASLRS